MLRPIPKGTTLKIVEGHVGTWYVEATMPTDFKGFNPQAVFITNSKEKCEKVVEQYKEPIAV